MIKYGFLQQLMSCKLVLCLTGVFLYLPSQGQLAIDTTLSPSDMVFKLLSLDKSEIMISKVSYTGAKQSIAFFTNESPEELIDEGIILSTGNVFDAIGPNKSTKTGKPTSGYRDNDLQSIATGIVTDACVLEFDLLSLRDSIVFEYIFASEEYPEYVSKGVNDVFGFFIQEIGGKAVYPLNLAKVPNSKKTVSVDNINHRINEEYFLRSDFLEAHNLAFWQQHKKMMMRARIFEFDGFTTPLKASIRLKQGKSYHLKIAIADVGDRFYDSVIMLKAHSFETTGKRIEKADSIVASVVSESMMLHNPSFELSDNLSFDLIVNFNTNEAIILEQSFEELNDLADLLLKIPALKVRIIGHTDDVGKTENNLILSQDRAKAVRNFLSNKGINQERISTEGKGESEPIKENNSEKNRFENRRVEFQLMY